MDRTALENTTSGSTSRDWLNQTLKSEPFCPGRLSCHSSVGTTYFSATSAAGLDNSVAGAMVADTEYPAFPLHCLPAHAFQNAFAATGPTETGNLARAHAMHSLFETYAIEGGTARQYTSVRMDHQIIPRTPHMPGRPRGHKHSASLAGDAEAGEEEEEEEAEGKEMMTGGEASLRPGGSSALSRASYTCRKCKAHGHAVPVKRHKRACPYLQCQCLKCRLVDQGRKVVARQIALYRDQKGHIGGGSGSSSACGGSDSNYAHSRTPAHRGDPSHPSHLARVTGLRPPTPSPASSAIPLQLSMSPEPRIDENSRVLPMVHLMSSGGTKGVGQSAMLGSAVGPHCRRCRNHNVAVTWKGHKKSCPYRNCPCDPCRLINVRKDTEKTLRDMAGIDEKTMLPTPVTPDDEVQTNNFFPYLTPVTAIRSSAENANLQPSIALAEHQNGAGITWMDPLDARQASPRKIRSLQDINASAAAADSKNQSNSPNSPTVEIPQVGAPGHGQTSPARNASSPSNEPHFNCFEQYHNRSSYDAYNGGDEKCHRPRLPFWQSFGPFDDKHASGQGYINGYYGLDNGRVFHGNNQGHHMYSPERVSAVAAAAAAAAAMVAMTPPIGGAYQQSYYGGPQGRGMGGEGSSGPGGGVGGGFCHHRLNQQVDHAGSYGEDFNVHGGSGYNSRTRGEDFRGAAGYGWGSYRYPCMVRGLPFNPEEHMETYPSTSGGQRTSKAGDEMYARPMAHMWRSQLQHLSISNLGGGECVGEEKRNQQVGFESKAECRTAMKTDCGTAISAATAVEESNRQPQALEMDTQRQRQGSDVTNHSVVIPTSNSTAYPNAGYSGAFSRPGTSPPDPQMSRQPQPQGLFDTPAAVDVSNQQPPYQQSRFEQKTSTLSFATPIDETSHPPAPPPPPHNSFHSVRTET